MPKSSIPLEEFFLTVYWPLRLVPKLADLENDLLIAKHLTRLQRLERSPYLIAKERSQLLAIANLAKKRGYIDCAFEVVAAVLPLRSQGHGYPTSSTG